MASLHTKTTPTRRNKLPLDTPKRFFPEVMHSFIHLPNPPAHYHSRILLCLLPRRLLFRLLLPLLVEHSSALKDGKTPAFLCSS